MSIFDTAPRRTVNRGCAIERCTETSVMSVLIQARKLDDLGKPKTGTNTTVSRSRVFCESHGTQMMRNLVTVLGGNPL